MSSAALTRSRNVSVFVSYSTSDERLANDVVAYLEKRQGTSCFLAPRNIPAGEYWGPRLESEIQGSDVVLLLYTPSSAQSEYVQQEIRWAERERTPIWMLKDPDLKLNEFFGGFGFTKRQAYPLRANDQTACLDSLVASLETIHLKLNLGTGVIDAAANPYPGFGPFNESNTRFYFGREDDCESLANALYDGPRSGDFKPAGAAHETGSNLLLMYGPSGVGKSSLLRVGLPTRVAESDWISKPILFSQYQEGEDRSEFLMRAAWNQLRAHNAAPREDAVASGQLVQAIADLVREQEQKGTRHCIFCFDQMEELFEQRVQKTQIDDFLNDVLHLLRVTGVRILVSFREEALGAVERRVEDLAIPCRRWRIGELSVEKAKECIVGPAQASGVDFQEALADELVNVLARPHGRDLYRHLVYSVEPVSLQLVCRSLWQRVATSHARINTRIHESNLPGEGLTLHERVRRFVEEVVKEYLGNVIDEVAEERVRADTSGRIYSKEQWLEFIQTSLVLFVGQGKGQRRQRVPEVQLPDGTKRVGRFSEELIRTMVNKGLVHRCDDAPEYELVHDVLAETIDREYRGSVMLVPKLNILESSLRDVTQGAASSARTGAGKEPLRGFFNANSTLLNDLEDARQNVYFHEEEAAFLVRCALGHQDQHLPGYRISSLGWAQDLGKNSPHVLAGIIEDGLQVNPEEELEVQQRSDPVRLDVIALLRTPEIRSCLVDRAKNIDHMKGLIAPLRKAALSGTTDVREKACAALLEMEDQQGVEELFTDFREKREREARSTMILLRHAADTTSSHKSYWERWKQLGRWTRLAMLRAMCAFRARQSSARMLLILAVCAPMTAVGAAIPFIFAGYLGASLTLEDAAFGAVKGLFHGVSGGLVWGLTIAGALLLYGVVWRGGRIRAGKADALPILFWSVTGGVIGGIANTIMIAFVYSKPGILDAGWVNTKPATVADMLRQIFWQTRCGFVLPIFGAMLGVGIAWSLAAIMGDPVEAWAADLTSISTIGDAWGVARSIGKKVLKSSWRNAIMVAFAGLLVYCVVVPGPGVCDPSAPMNDAQCSQSPQHLAALPYRAAGLVPVILGGSLALELAFLFSVVSVRIGVKVEESRDFLQSAGPYATPVQPPAAI